MNQIDILVILFLKFASTTKKNDIPAIIADDRKVQDLLFLECKFKSFLENLYTEAYGEGKEGLYIIVSKYLKMDYEENPIQIKRKDAKKLYHASQNILSFINEILNDLSEIEVMKSDLPFILSQKYNLEETLKNLKASTECFTELIERVVIAENKRRTNDGFFKDKLLNASLALKILLDNLKYAIVLNNKNITSNFANPVKRKPI